MSARASGTLVGPIAVRAFTKRQGKGTRSAFTADVLGWSGDVLILDTETSIDASQRLLFGSYQYCRETNGHYAAIEEGLIYADELPLEDPKGFATLRAHMVRERANVSREHSRQLRFYSRAEFIEKVFFPAACRAEALMCGFNLPFDLSRLAIECSDARRWYYGGFSLALADYPEEKKKSRAEDTYYARVAVKPIDSKRGFIGFAGGKEPHKGMGMRGRFLDLRSLAFALTDRSHSLDSACTAFGVKQGKGHAAEHGRITDDYIGYNRRDVAASLGLLNALRAELTHHPISLDPCKAYSPAAIAKAHLEALGIALPATQFRDVPPKFHGYAMTAYYGGRAEVRVRNTQVPVVYTDFLSMYPTVYSLMGLWPVLIAERLEIRDATVEVREMLAGLSPDRCFDPAYWQELLFLAEIRPNRDILPIRARYSKESDAFNIGVNPVTSNTSLWYAGPDVVASTLLTGRPPEIVRAFRIVPRGQQQSLTPLRVGGRIPIDPRKDDFFRTLIEARKTLNKNPQLSPDDVRRLDPFIKVVANSGSYGVFAEINVNDRPKKSKLVPMRLFGIRGTRDFRIRTPEELGKYCFPIIAALIPAAARLMLALLERTVTEYGGHFALCDTDSMAIVATEHGGIMECPGGPLRASNGKSAIRALRWADVDAIVERFRALSPYNPTMVEGSILKIERENFRDGAQCQLYVYPISAKRYALFTRATDGLISIVKKSDHGLGHLLNPTDANSDNTDWIEETWHYLIARALRVPAREPKWLDRPAIARITISSPHLYRPFATDPKSYRTRVKPFNFALSAQVALMGHPAGVDPKQFHLVAPFERDARKWQRVLWTDIHSGAQYAIHTGTTASTRSVHVKSYRDVLESYATHPEPKSAAPDGGECGRETRGLLQRRPIHAAGVLYIGKESNKIEDVDLGLVHDWDDVQQVIDVTSTSLRSLRARMRKIKVAELATQTGLSVRQLQRIRNGHAEPNGAMAARIDAGLHVFASAASTPGPVAGDRGKDTRAGRQTPSGPSRRRRSAPKRAKRKAH